MNIILPPEIEQALVAAAKHLGVSAETLVLDALQERFETFEFQKSHDSWEDLLRSVGSPTGVSLSDEATDRQHAYH